MENKSDLGVSRGLIMLPVGDSISLVYSFGVKNEMVECGNCSFIEFRAHIL